MIATKDETLTWLVAAVRAADPADDLPWLVLSDRLDEIGDDRAKRLRLWLTVRTDVGAAVSPGGTRAGWLPRIQRRVERLGQRSGLLCRLYAATAIRVFAPALGAKRHPLAGATRLVLSDALMMAELYAFGLADDASVSNLRVRVGVVRDHFTSSTWRNLLSAAEWCLERPTPRQSETERDIRVAFGVSQCLGEARVRGQPPPFAPAGDRLANAYAIEQILSRFEHLARFPEN